LELEFNSLHAQREAGVAYIASQKSEGWIGLPDHYDDGGISGGTLERPALKRLLRDVEAALIDVVVVYKIDRLSRSLTDFAKLVDVFERHNVTFVSVTQQFNTTTSMGRLTLNILLSFAQFEREVIGERIRDKFAASRKKGIWMGGWPPLGYEVENRRLVVIEREAALVRRIFDRFAKSGSALTVARELNATGEVTKQRPCANGARGGKPWTRGAMYKVLANRIYLGEAVHKGVAYPGEHAAIIDQRAWDKAHAVMAESPHRRGAATRARVPALLKSLLHGPNGRPMSPSHTRRRGRIYRYYVAREAIADGYDTCPVTSVPAADVEGAVLDHGQKLLATPELVARTWAAAKREGDEITEREVTILLADFATLWNELFPAEKARIVQLLVERVDLQQDALEVRIRAEGLGSLVTELRQHNERRAA
jgi:DNA invertase Pin-like site-specific DNA recombinase